MSQRFVPHSLIFAVCFALSSSPEAAAADPVTPSGVSLAMLRLEEQLARFRREQTERILALEGFLLSRLDIASTQPLIRREDSFGVSLQRFVIVRGETGMFSSIREIPSFVRIVDTEMVRETFPPQNLVFLQHYAGNQHYAKKLVAKPVSRPVLTFREAVEAGDINRAMVFPRFEIDFELSKQSGWGIICGDGRRTGVAYFASE